MAHFLLVYNRDTVTLIRNDRYDHAAAALQARFRAEAEFRGRSEVEIVALSAESEGDLLQTHGRYFLKLSELAERIR